VVDAWSKATEEIAKEMMKEISSTKKTAKAPTPTSTRST